MSDRLKDRLAVITGGASGIGRASAILFAVEGARVVVCDVDLGAGEEVCEGIRAVGGRAWFRATDVTDEQAVADTFRWVDENAGSVDVLYNCAGGSTNDDAPVERLSIDTLDHVLRLELRSVMLCSREAVPRMRSHGSGAILNMASFVAFRGVFDIHAYIASKGALVSLTRAMAASNAPHNIRVNAIAPGIALSERAAARIKEANVAGAMTFKWSDYPFAMGTPDDIANVALFLASDESRMITGQTIVADGGLSSY